MRAFLASCLGIAGIVGVAGCDCSAEPAKGPKTGCDPPYTLDSQGHKHYKVECL